MMNEILSSGRSLFISAYDVFPVLGAFRVSSIASLNDVEVESSTSGDRRLVTIWTKQYFLELL